MRKYLLFFLILVFGVYSAWVFSDSVTPYVSISEAKESASSKVQVKGLLDKNVPPGMDKGNFCFSLMDEATGETMPVRYRGLKPDQFDQAYHVVAIGTYQNNEFVADKLLIKCPSKYEKEVRP